MLYCAYSAKVVGEAAPNDNNDDKIVIISIHMLANDMHIKILVY